MKARNLHRASHAAAKLVQSPRLAALAAAALGTPSVRLYQVLEVQWLERAPWESSIIL